jgi:hypothetical protein
MQGRGRPSFNSPSTLETTVSTASRTTWIRRSLLSLVVLAVLAFTLHATVFSGASFTAGSVNPGAIFFSGTLAHSNDVGGTFAVDATGLLPGASQTGVMILQGAGTVPARYALCPIGLTDTPHSPALSGVLTLKVEDVTAAPVTLYSGTVAGFSSADLGSIAAGATRSYRLTLAYPAGANSAGLQGASMTLDLDVTGATS